MSLSRRQRFIHAQTAWMLTTIVLLAVLNALSFEMFFLLSLMGFLIVTAFATPFNVTPEWHTRLRWLIAAGLAIFGYIAIRRIVGLLPFEVI